MLEGKTEVLQKQVLFIKRRFTQSEKQARILKVNLKDSLTESGTNSKLRFTESRIKRLV